MLILQLDTGKLEADGLSLLPVANGVGLPLAAAGLDVEVVSSTTEADLHAKLGVLAKDGRTFDVIVTIAHSNAQVIAIAEGKVLQWSVFAQYLKPFEPRRLLLIACKAGSASAANVLFKGLPKLRRIYACPVNARLKLAGLLMAAAPLMLAVKAPSKETVRNVQMLIMGSTGGQLRHWMRTRDKDNPDASMLDELSDLADPLVLEVPRILGSVVQALSSRT